MRPPNPNWNDDTTFQSSVLTHLHVRNYRCLENVEVPLSPLTAIVEPNGVGKTTVLRQLSWYWVRLGQVSVASRSPGAAGCGSPLAYRSACVSTFCGPTVSFLAFFLGPACDSGILSHSGVLKSSEAHPPRGTKQWINGLLATEPFGSVGHGHKCL